MVNYYKILGVSLNASEDEIRKQFRKLALIHHPDKNGGNKDSERTFKIILKAYETLKDKDKRDVYDLTLSQHFQSSVESATVEPVVKNKNSTKLGVFIIIAIVIIIYMLNNKENTVSDVDGIYKEQIEDFPIEDRPESGELNF